MTSIFTVSRQPSVNTPASSRGDIDNYEEEEEQSDILTSETIKGVHSQCLCSI